MRLRLVGVERDGVAVGFRRSFELLEFAEGVTQVEMYLRAFGAEAGSLPERPRRPFVAAEAEVRMTQREVDAHSAGSPELDSLAVSQRGDSVQPGLPTNLSK